MSPRLGFVRYSGTDTRETFVPEKDYSPDTARLIDEEIRRIVDEAYAEAERLLEANWEKVVAVAEALLRHETLSADEVRTLMRGEPLSKPTVSELLAAEARKDQGVTLSPRAQPEPPPEIPTGVLPRPA
jgi:cell division protease FtsH